MMHGPDGTDYQEWISWTEIARRSGSRCCTVSSVATRTPSNWSCTFAPDGAATRIEMRTAFATKELRDQAVEKYHAIEGGQQTLGNLAAYVAEIVRKERRADGREGVLQRDEEGPDNDIARATHERTGASVMGKRTSSRSRSHPCCSAPESACSRAWTRAASPWSRSARRRRSV